MKFYSESKEDVLKELSVNRDRGLSSDDVKSRRDKYGLNEFTPMEEGSFWDDLKDALSEPMIVILIIAAIISAVIGEFHDAIGIVCAIAIGIAIGMITEGRSKKAAEALSKLTENIEVKVLRDGEVEQVSKSELVPGDIVFIETGDMIPADGRLIKSINLKVREDMLTGESDDVSKKCDAIINMEKVETKDGIKELEPIPAKQINMVFGGTLVAYGTGMMVVTSIGDNTFYNCKNITIYGYSGSYAETYAVAHNIPFESLGDVIGSHEYDYSSTLDQWLLDKGTSNSMNYLIHGDNFLCTQSVAYYDSSNSEKLVETMSNMIYRGLDGWRDIFIKDTTKEQARDVLLALLKEQESEVSMLAKAEAGEKYAGIFVDSFKNANWAFAVNYGLNSEEINSLAELCTKDQIAEFLKSGKDVTISAYLQMKGGYSADSKVVKCIESFAKSKTFINRVVEGADFISDATKVLSLGEKTINNYYDIQRLLNADKMYEEMLLFIANDTGSVPVKNAAQELYNALHGGWRELTNLLAGDIENEVANKVYDKLVGKVIAA